MAPKMTFRRRSNGSVDAIKCSSGDNPDELLLCDGCNLGIHIFCLHPILACMPYGPWLCPSCSSNKSPKPFPLIQTKIVDFFRIQRSSDIEKLEIRKQKRWHGGLVMLKKKRKLLPYVPTKASERRMEQMASLTSALMTTGAVFSDNLTNCYGMAPRSVNRPKFEHGGMQILAKEDIKALVLCKKMMGIGECPPLMVVFDPREGFTVEADRCIKVFKRWVVKYNDAGVRVVNGVEWMYAGFPATEVEVQQELTWGRQEKTEIVGDV